MLHLDRGGVAALLVVEQFHERVDVLLPHVSGGAADEDERVVAVVEHDNRAPVLGLGFGGDEHGWNLPWFVLGVMGIAVLATWVKMAGRAVVFKYDSGILGGFL